MRAKPRAHPIVHTPGDENCWGNLLSRGVMRTGGPVCVHASVDYKEVLFAESDKFSTREVVRGVQAAAAEGGPYPRYCNRGGFAGFRRAVLGGAPWPLSDLDAEKG